MSPDSHSPPARRTARCWPRSSRGSIEVLAILILFTLLILLSTALFFNRVAFMMSETVDRIRQSSNDRTAVERYVREVILARAEVAPFNSTTNADALIDSLLTEYNSSAGGIVISRAAPAPNLAGLSPAMFPSNAPAITTPNLEIVAGRFQTKRLMARGAAMIGGPISFQFVRTVASNSAENRTITVDAQPISVPMCNWPFIAYGLPGLGSVPASAPGGAGGVLSGTAFQAAGAEPMLLTPLRPASYPGGDPTAFAHLYSEDGSGQSALPAYYRPFDSIAWRAWDFVWSGGSWPLTSYTSGFYQDRLLHYALQLVRNTGSARTSPAVLDLSAFGAAAIDGVSVEGNTVTIDLGAYPEDILYVVDSSPSTINLIGAPNNARGALVLVVANYATALTRINYSGTNARTTLVYSRGAENVFAGGTSFTGGVYLDPRSSAAGTATINGVFAYYGATQANPFPAFALTLNPPSGYVLTDLRAVTPRVLLVATESYTN